jgi:hypothetical protein
VSDWAGGQQPDPSPTPSASPGTSKPRPETSVSAQATPVSSAVHEQQDLARRLAELQKKNDELAEQVRALRQQRTGERIGQTLQSVRVSRLRDSGREARDELRALKSGLAGWNARLTSLLTNDAGKQIGADPQSVRLFAAILDNTVLDETQIGRWEGELEQLLEPLDASLAEDTRLQLPDEFVTELNALKRAVREKRDELDQQQAALNALLGDADGQQRPGLRLSATLEDALQEYRNEQSRRRAEFIAQATEEIEEERTRRLAEEALADARRAEQQRQAERQAKLEREALEREFERSLPEIRRYLTPFITPGNRQFGQTYTEEKKPLSFSGIQQAGALDNTAIGHQKFMFLAGGSANDRPSGVFPTYIGGHVHDPRDVVRAQNLLKRFGDLLVEKKMLEP